MFTQFAKKEVLSSFDTTNPSLHRSDCQRTPKQPSLGPIFTLWKIPLPNNNSDLCKGTWSFPSPSHLS